jgi:uncharacterized protein involved in exopolysaccharide biosynthesis
MTDKGVGFIDYFYILAQWRKMIFLNFIIVCFIAAGISLILPKVHRAQTTILPPIEESDGFGLSSLLSKVPLSSLSIGLGSVSEETYTFLAIINSRTVMESIVREFDLRTRYRVKNIEKAVKKLRKNVSVKVNDEGTITLSTDVSTKWLSDKATENETRKLARDMANFFIKELDRVNKHLKTERARNSRIFIEKRYLQNITDLHRAEEEFKQFQKKYGTIALPEQTSATISAATELKVQIISKEVEGGVLQKYVGPSHSEYLKVQNELNELRMKLNEFKSGERQNKENTKNSKGLFLALNDVPDIGLQYGRLYREIFLQEKIMEFLLPQYESAKIQEAKTTPTLQVLDEAVIPIKRMKPKRAFFVMFWGVLSIFMSFCIVFIIEYLESLKRLYPEKYHLIETVNGLLLDDFRKLKRKRR